MPFSPSPLSVIRPEDLLHLQFSFLNLVINNDDPKSPFLIRDNPDKDAYLIVFFPPQHLNEEAFFEVEPEEDESPDPNNPPDNDEPNPAIIEPNTPAHVYMAGMSRLVFRVPPKIRIIPYTMDGLLNWADLELSVAPTALPPNPVLRTERPFLVNPHLPENNTYTALELPYRLILSPNNTARWFHSLLPVTKNGRSELWHTRLGTRREDGTATEAPNDQRTVRAIWSFDLNKNPSNAPSPNSAFLASLDPSHRHKLVHLSANFQLKDQTYDPPPVNVDQMMLTSLGAWMKINGKWQDQTLSNLGLNIESWKHTTTQGRDQYVRIVIAGRLYPTWHRASFVIITERKSQSTTDDDDNITAYLRQRLHIIPRKRERVYAHPDPVANERYQRANLFSQKIRILTRITPKLDPLPQMGQTGFIADPAGSFWIKVAGEPFLFHLQGTDPDGKIIDIHKALIFVPDGPEVTEANLKKLRNAYFGMTEWRRGIVDNKDITYAPKGNGNTTLQTSSLFFDSEVLPKPPPMPPEVLPILQTAEVRIPAVEQIIGSQAPQAIKLFKTYLDKGLEDSDNKAALFAEMVDAAGLTVKVPPDKAGGMATPNLDISGLSRHLGPVGGNLEKLAQGTFNPADFFRTDAKLLGGIILEEIIADIFEVNQFPKMLTERLPDTPEKLVTRLEWHPTVKSTDIFRTLPENSSNPATDMRITAKFEQQLKQGTEPGFTVDGTIKEFAINFLEVIEVQFDSISFHAGENEKLDVSAQIKDQGINFLGPLSFLNELRKFIPPDGFVDPPYLDVTPSGASVGFTQALPPFAVGVFSLTNVSVGAILHLPFTDAPARLRFNFSERHDPFNVTVTLLGGGGFFALALGLDGIEMIEASIEFGGNVAIDLGVASGGIYIMAGLYFKHEKGNKVQFAGYVRAGGYLNVLGLISISVEFYLELSYLEGTTKVTGRASVTVKVEVLFFSKTVTLTVEKTFSGSSDDPTFSDVMTANNWKNYGLYFG